jgi:DNA-binding NtrC family response regulator
MQLLADRFVVDEEGEANDAATDTRVTVMLGDAGDVAEQMRWAARCDAWQKLHHRAIAPLLDYGMVGPASRFEAWRCGSAWRGAPDVARAAFATAFRTVRALGLSVADGAGSMRVSADGGVLWLPDVAAGYPIDGCVDPADDIPLADRAIGIVERPAVTTLAEMFEGTHESRPHVAALCGVRGCGKGVVVDELARIARLRGYVPVSSRLASGPHAQLWRNRSLFIIDESGDGDGWSSLLHAALGSGYPHALLIVSDEVQESIDAVRLEPVTPDALIAALRPRALSARLETVARRAAERASGLPGEFARLLSIARADARPRRRPAHAGLARVVAEHPVVYGADSDATSAGHGIAVALGAPSAWPSPAELDALRRRMASAVALLTAGRLASGIRQLRDAIGGLARRHAWTDAATGGIALAHALLGRGRVREAQSAIDAARQHAARCGNSAILLDLVVLSGHAWIDLARLDEAESVLATAVSAARVARDRPRSVDASLALARCLFWRGRYVDADATLSALPDDLLPAVRGRRARLTARVAVGLGDGARALAVIATECESSRASQDARSIASAARTAAFVHLAVGDLDAVERDVAGCVAAARRAHDSLCAVRARLLLAEGLRRRGRTTSKPGAVRLERMTGSLPPIVRARWTLTKALALASDVNVTVARQVAAVGLPALALYAPVDREPLSDAAPTDHMLDDIVAILRTCQVAKDDSVVLKDICARVRERVHAAAVAFVGNAGGHAELLACDGAKLDTGVAERAIAAGVTVTPHRHDDRIDAAAPVQYGGVPIGAICARWTVGSTHNVSRAGAVLTASAAAAAPILSAALSRRERAAAIGTGDLLGVAPTMVELRRSVERAAAAPFAVLIDGESGSGKELVARAIHRGGQRRDRAFHALNCAALPDELVEAELFGHARGSFTGAIADRVGAFEEAHGGTLLLDEIGELSLRAQAKILRVLQEGELRRVGDNVSRRIDVRIIAATNRDLRQEVAAGRFRLDLLYRLDVVRIRVPPLRERREDIAVLAEHFWRESTARLGSRATLGVATIATLARYDWPGNVRELQNVLAALTVRSPRRGIVPPEALPPPFIEGQRDEAWRLDEARRTFETRFVRAALVRSGGHRGRAAAELGVTRQGLTKLLSRLGIGGE